MNKKLKLLIPIAVVSLCASVSVGVLSGCGEKEPEHECTYTRWNHDGEVHWKECVVDDKKGPTSPHVFDHGVCECGYEDPDYVAVTDLVTFSVENQDPEHPDDTTLVIKSDNTAIMGSGSRSYSFSWTYSADKGLVFVQDGKTEEQKASLSGKIAKIELSLKVSAGGQDVEVKKKFICNDITPVTGGPVQAKTIATFYCAGSFEGDMALKDDGTGSFSTGGHNLAITWSCDYGALIITDAEQTDKVFAVTIKNDNKASFKFSKPLGANGTLEWDCTCDDISEIVAKLPEKAVDFAGQITSPVTMNVNLAVFKNGKANINGKEMLTWKYENNKLTFTDVKASKQYEATINGKAASFTYKFNGQIDILLSCADVTAIIGEVSEIDEGIASFTGEITTPVQMSLVLVVYQDGTAKLNNGNKTMENFTWSYSGGKLAFTNVKEGSEPIEATVAGNAATLQLTSPVPVTLSSTDISALISNAN